MRKKKIRLFTLVELLAAMVIIAILVGLASKGVQFANTMSGESATKATIEIVNRYFDRFKEKNGFYPNQPEEGVEPKGDALKLDFALHYKQINGSDPTEDNLRDFIRQYIPNYSEMVESGRIYVHTPTGEPTAAYLLDGFGEQFRYRCPGKHNESSYDLWSMGADGKTSDNGDEDPEDSEDSEDSDNIKNWE